MVNYTAITENDESQWEDVTGLQYHFPKRYLKYLQPGTKVLYYKGKLTNKKFRLLRLSDDPHYFGTGVVKELRNDETDSSYFAIIEEFNLFTKAVPFKVDGNFYEEIPEKQKTNYWRNGVRPITKEIYDRVIEVAVIKAPAPVFHDQAPDSFETTEVEGGSKKVYTTVYERNKVLRDKAIFIHGYSCMACGFNFKQTYGEWGEGYIHVHHLKPISSINEKAAVNPETDLVVVCANCHSMIHRRKDKLLSLEDLRSYMTLKVR